MTRPVLASRLKRHYIQRHLERALRAMDSVLYGVDVYDMRTILTVVLMFASVTLIATTVPTLRIAGIDRAKTLRDE